MEKQSTTLRKQEILVRHWGLMTNDNVITIIGGERAHRASERCSAESLAHFQQTERGCGCSCTGNQQERTGKGVRYHNRKGTSLLSHSSCFPALRFLLLLLFLLLNSSLLHCFSSILPLLCLFWFSSLLFCFFSFPDASLFYSVSFVRHLTVLLYRKLVRRSWTRKRSQNASEMRMRKKKRKRKMLMKKLLKRQRIWLPRKNFERYENEWKFSCCSFPLFLSFLLSFSPSVFSFLFPIGEKLHNEKNKLCFVVIFLKLFFFLNFLFFSFFLQQMDAVLLKRDAEYDTSNKKKKKSNLRQKERNHSIKLTLFGIIFSSEKAFFPS